MKLRTRLLFASALTTLPILLALLWLDARSRQQATRDDLAHLVANDMRDRRELCEADPAHFGGAPMGPPHHAMGDHGPPDDHGPPRGHPPDGGPRFNGIGGSPPVFFAFDAQLHSTNPNAPTLSEPPSAPLWPRREVSVLVDMPWREGPCAKILAFGSTNPDWVGGLLPQSPIWLLAIGGVWLALALTLGSTVRRLRALTASVKASAANNYTGEVMALGGGTDEIGDLARAFGDASATVRKQLAETESREQALRDYVANTTHDVMIPLTVLRAHLASLEEAAAAGTPVDKALLAQAITEADYLGALTTNLGVASKLDGEPQVVRTRFDLRGLIERVLARHATIARQGGVLLDGAVPEEPVEIEADVTLVEQAVNNLVANAIRYNKRDGHVALVLDCSGDRFVITVADDGPGIPTSEMSKITQRGVRGSASRTRGDGQGLGLAIVQRVASLMQMDLALQNAEAGGLEAKLSGRVLASEV
ncbi:MAG TPA: HAMP domain-containing sensor histidine kinase [Kofleriaceae bacterium]|jgi:signal transduction histidine kinase